MRALILTLLAVPLIDLAVKALLGRVLGSRAAALWTLWALSAGTLVVVSAWIPSSRPFVGLLLGGSLSNALESSLRGRVSDYVCLRFWPAFNLADVALTAGVIGVVAELLIAAQGTLS